MDITNYTQNLINRIIAHVEHQPGKHALTSIVLTGSLGRDEGTFHVNPKTNELILDSDVELALVYKSGKKKIAEEIKQSLMENFHEDLNPMTISESRVKNGYNFNYSLIPPKYSSIFMYDFYNGSKTIWGEDLLDNECCIYDIFEAKRIVANRIGELTYLTMNNTTNTEKLKKQWTAKLLLAIGSAYCIIFDYYTSAYAKQMKNLENDSDRLNQTFGKSFIRDYKNAYLFLRKGEKYVDVSDRDLRRYVKKINSLFIKYEINKPKINSISRKLKYAIACFKYDKTANIFTCETDIINELIHGYISDNKNISNVAEAWHRILY